MAGRKQSPEEKALRRYFATKNARGRGLFFLLGIAVLLAGLAGLGGQGTAYLLQLLGIGIVVISVLSGLVLALTPVPSDHQVDVWFDQRMDKLARESRHKLGIADSDVLRTREPLIVVGPILWETTGVDPKDLVWRKGKDDIVRFGIYDIAVIWLTERHLGAYECIYNFLKDVALNESTDEYHYQDVVAVSTREVATSYTLPTGEKLTRSQQFRVSVSSGEGVEVVIGADKLSKITGSERIPESGVEKAVSTIRAMLREKKP